MSVVSGVKRRIEVDRFKGTKGTARGAADSGHKARMMALGEKGFRVRGRRVRHSDIVLRLVAGERNQFQLFRCLGVVLGGVEVKLTLHGHVEGKGGEGYSLYVQQGGERL